MTTVVRFHELGGPDVLRLENLDVPRPAASEVKIRVEAIGLNRAELAFRAGRYLERPKLPSRLVAPSSALATRCTVSCADWLRCA